MGVHEHQNNVREHYYCIKAMFELYPKVDQLEKLAARPDLPTICAFDYNRMKSFALTGHGLHYHDYHPEVKGIQVPKME